MIELKYKNRNKNSPDGFNSRVRMEEDRSREPEATLTIWKNNPCIKINCCFSTLTLD